MGWPSIQARRGRIECNVRKIEAWQHGSFDGRAVRVHSLNLVLGRRLSCTPDSSTLDGQIIMKSECIRSADETL